MAVIVHEDTEVRAANPKWRCSTDGPSINVNHLERHGFQLRIHFMRTVRVPDNKSASKLPPDLGRFALFKIQDYAANLPTQMVAQGGLFFPMYQKEALWINFNATVPFMIKIHAGGVNAVSGEHKIEDLNTKFRRLKSYLEGKNVQDYVVAPEQPWLDGFATSSGVVRQFVAMPMGEGYSVEAQMTGQEVVGGLQFHITPIKVGPLTLGLFGDLKLFIKTLSGKVTAIYCNREDTIGSLKHIIQEREGMVPENQKWIYAGEQLDDERTLADYDIGNEASIYLFARLFGGGGFVPKHTGKIDMGIAAGGKIEQTIVKDTEDPDAWDGKASFTIPVHIVNSQAFHCITGQAPPPTPISASIYARAGLPFYKKYDEPTDIFGTFELVKSVNATEQDRGLATSTESPVHPRTVELNEQGRHHVHPSRVNTRNYIDDPDDLLNLVTEMDECRPLADLQTSLSDLKLVDIENELKQLDELEKTDGSY